MKPKTRWWIWMILTMSALVFATIQAFKETNYLLGVLFAATFLSWVIEPILAKRRMNKEIEETNAAFAQRFEMTKSGTRPDGMNFQVWERKPDKDTTDM